MTIVEKLDVLFWLVLMMAFGAGLPVGYTIREIEERRKVTFGCNESGDKEKDPRGCWNVRRQLGKVCCRSAARAAPGEPT